MISYAIFYKFLLSLQILFLPWWWRHGFESVSDTFSENPMLKICSLSIHPLKGNHVSLSRAAWESTIKNAIPWSQINIQYGLSPKLVMCKLCTVHLSLLRAKTFARIQTNDLLIMSLVFCHCATSAGNNIPTFKKINNISPDFNLSGSDARLSVANFQSVSKKVSSITFRWRRFFSQSSEKHVLCKVDG